MTYTVWYYEWWRTFFTFYLFFISSLSLLRVVWYIPCIEQEPHKWGCSPSLPEYKRQSDCSPIFICMYLYIYVYPWKWIYFCLQEGIAMYPPQCRDCRRWYRETRCTIQSNFHSGSVPEVLMKNIILEGILHNWPPCFGSRKVTKLIFFMHENLKCWFSSLKALY